MFSTGYVELDSITGYGGFPVGPSELFGPFNSGTTTIALNSIAAQQKAGGKKAALIDVASEFNEDYARAMGVDLDALLLYQPLAAQEAVVLAQSMCHDPEVGIVFIDSVAGMAVRGESGRTAGLAQFLSRTLRVIAPLSQRTGTGVVFMNKTISAPTGGSVSRQSRGGNALSFYSLLRMILSRKDANGLVEVEVVKNRDNPAFRAVEFNLWGPQ